MSNSIFEDALFLAAGGIVGLIAGAALMSDDEDDEDEEEEARVAPKAAGRSIEELVASLKSEAQQALVNCETDEEREEVSASIRKSIEGWSARAFGSPLRACRRCWRSARRRRKPRKRKQKHQLRSSI
ncbi:hypothetical protein [uncultured Selenomonas sp.]|uniref:hypothetical protein n=1 Tax=uncultured Selenomonas sp. TaxID=159275 RepID=UPI0025DC3BEA|nr:hypothetical protein [uncultured Selenomonas sp.]